MLMPSDFRNRPGILVLTGSGISTASGIPTYRDEDSGWWSGDGELERKSHADSYEENLPFLWKHWSRLRSLANSSAPNDAHMALVEWEKKQRERGGWLHVVTQNVDGLHHRSGLPESRVNEIHGSIHRGKCLDCKNVFPLTDGLFSDEQSEPACPRCSSYRTRPGMILFGEQLGIRQMFVVDDYLRAAHIVVFVGTSGSVYPVNSFPMKAKLWGKRVVLVNKEPWEGYLMAGFSDFLRREAAVGIRELISEG